MEADCRMNRTRRGELALIKVHHHGLPGAKGFPTEAFSAFLEPVDGRAWDAGHASQGDVADEAFRLGFRGEGLDGGFQRMGEARQPALRVIRPGPDDAWFCDAGEEADAGAVQAHDIKVHASVRDGLLKIGEAVGRDFAKEFEREVKMFGGRPADFSGVGGAFEFVLGAFQFVHDGLGNGNGDEQAHVQFTIHDLRLPRHKKGSFGNQIWKPIMSKQFYEAATFGDMDTVKKMLASDASLVHAKIEWGFTALHGVAGEEQLEMAEFLLDHGADPNAKNEDGITPMHLAVYPEMIELFVRRGGDIEIRSNDGRTPLLVWASEQEGFETMEALLKLGADAKAKDNSGQSAVDFARSREEEDKIELLKQHGG